jgi:hypothetical protein
VAELADALDSGFQDYRFQTVSTAFKDFHQGIDFIDRN